MQLRVNDHVDGAQQSSARLPAGEANNFKASKTSTESGNSISDVSRFRLTWCEAHAERAHPVAV